MTKRVYLAGPEVFLSTRVKSAPASVPSASVTDLSGFFLRMRKMLVIRPNLSQSKVSPSVAPWSASCGVVMR